MVFFPLIGAALVGGFLRPALNSGMARSFDATVALSAFAVATSLSWMVISPTQNLHQLTMIWLPRPGGRARAFRFVLVFSLVFTLVIAVLRFTPVGPWLLLGPIGLERSLLTPTILVVRIQALIPLVLSWSEYFSGILLINRQTSAITVGKLVNLAVVLAGVALFHGARLPSGTALGALLQVLGIAGEVLFLYAVVRRAGRAGPGARRRREPKSGNSRARGPDKTLSGWPPVPTTMGLSSSLRLQERPLWSQPIVDVPPLLATYARHHLPNLG